MESVATNLQHYSQLDIVDHNELSGFLSELNGVHADLFKHWRFANRNDYDENRMGFGSDEVEG